MWGEGVVLVCDFCMLLCSVWCLDTVYGIVLVFGQCEFVSGNSFAIQQ